MNQKEEPSLGLKDQVAKHDKMEDEQEIRENIEILESKNKILNFKIDI